MDEILKSLEEEIQTFEKLFSELENRKPAEINDETEWKSSPLTDFRATDVSSVRSKFENEGKLARVLPPSSPGVGVANGSPPASTDTPLSRPKPQIKPKPILVKRGLVETFENGALASQNNSPSPPISGKIRPAVPPKPSVKFTGSLPSPIGEENGANSFEKGGKFSQNGVNGGACEEFDLGTEV